MNPPPPVLDNARVLEYAIVDSSVRFSGSLQLFHGGKRVGPVPGLAICRDPDVVGLLPFHCDQAGTYWAPRSGTIPAAQVLQA